MGLNKPVDFTTAKLLKEKGFDENCRFGYNGSFEPHHIGLIEFGYLQRNSELLKLTYSAPTIAEVVMWCFNKYKYSIEYSMNIPESGEYDGCYVFNGLIKGSEDYKLKIFYTSKDYPTVEKALEDTINHFLINFC